MTSLYNQRHVAIACGGTGGHLFPGLAVGQELRTRGFDVTLFISPKEVDQAGVASVRDQFRVSVLPAIGLSLRKTLPYIQSLRKSWHEVSRVFRAHPPSAVLAMGGFTSVSPIFAGRRFGAATLLHESNTIPGRANQWLAPWVDECLVGFEEAAARLRCRHVTRTGTPVRSGFFGIQPQEARQRLGLDPLDPVLLVMGGSQGAAGINRRMAAAYPEILRRVPNCQWVHITGTREFSAYEPLSRNWPGRGRLLAFSSEMELWMAAATAAVTRSGASSLAESAAVRLPSVLIPFPAATADHQTWNARAFANQGAAYLLPEAEATSERLVALLVPLLTSPSGRQKMQTALARLALPEAASRIADRIVAAVARRSSFRVGTATTEPPLPSENKAPLGTKEVCS